MIAFLLGQDMTQDPNRTLSAYDLLRVAPRCKRSSLSASARSSFSRRKLLLTGFQVIGTYRPSDGAPEPSRDIGLPHASSVRGVAPLKRVPIKVISEKSNAFASAFRYQSMEVPRTTLLFTSIVSKNQFGMKPMKPFGKKLRAETANLNSAIARLQTEKATVEGKARVMIFVLYCLTLIALLATISTILPVNRRSAMSSQAAMGWI